MKRQKTKENSIQTYAIFRGPRFHIFWPSLETQHRFDSCFYISFLFLSFYFLTPPNYTKITRLSFSSVEIVIFSLEVNRKQKNGTKDNMKNKDTFFHSWDYLGLTFIGNLSEKIRTREDCREIKVRPKKSWSRVWFLFHYLWKVSQ